MRILHLNDRLSQRGGADWHLLSVLADLVSRGHELLLAVGRNDRSAHAPCPTVRVRNLESADRKRLRPTLDSVASSFAPDAIHVHNVMNPEALEWAASHGAIMTVQDHRCFCPGRGKLRFDGEACHRTPARELCTDCFTDPSHFQEMFTVTAERLTALRGMRGISVLSRYMQQELVAVGVDEAMIQVIPPFVHGLDPDATASGPPCVLFAGRLVVAKGVDDALEVWRRADLDLPLVYAGSGGAHARLEAAGCEMLGWVPHEQLSAVYRRARALIFSPRWQEPFGIVGLEALSMGVPVAAWASGGVNEWHPEGDLAPWGDLDALASRLRRAVSEPTPQPPAFERQRLMDALVGLYA